MIRLLFLIAAIFMFALLGLNVLLTIDLIVRHPLEWLAGGLTFLAASFLPFPDVPTTRSNA